LKKIRGKGILKRKSGGNHPHLAYSPSKKENAAATTRIRPILRRRRLKNQGPGNLERKGGGNKYAG